MIYGSVCSGIEAATVAWHPLGWTPRWFAEIDPAPSKVLAHHYPHVPNLGDFTAIGEQHGAVDLLVGGTPCQSFSIAGIRGGLADARGTLTLEFCKLAARLRPRWIVWENVPGVLSADGGRAMGAFLGALAELGYGFAWRVLDAQFFGVPQRRRRVFVVGRAGGDWRRAAEVLFEREGGGGDPAAGGEAREGDPRESARGARGAGVYRMRGFGDFVESPTASTLKSRDWKGSSVDLLVTRTVTSKWAKGSGGPSGNECGNLVVEPLAFHLTQDPVSGPVSPALLLGSRQGCATIGVQSAGLVRRLTPRECERLQGFPDDYTAILSDSARYRALGNSMAVPVMRWIGERIDRIERRAHGRS